LLGGGGWFWFEAASLGAGELFDAAELLAEGRGGAGSGAGADRSADELLSSSAAKFVLPCDGSGKADFGGGALE
jgi:hypothetical protein